MPFKELVNFAKEIINNTNASIRKDGTELFKVIYSYTGPDLNNLLNEINPNVLKSL